MTQQVYLGIDLGAESGRVMAGLWDGSQMRLEELHRFPNGPVEIAGTLRWDVLRLWSEIQNGLAVAGRRFGAEVVSVGVDTWALDYVLLSHSGEMLGLPFCYRDARTRGLVNEATGRVPRAEIFAASGLQFMEINTLYQWIAHHRASPEVFHAAESFLMIPDFFNWCLSGARVAEFTNATTTQFFHPIERAWSTRLLQKFDLFTHLLPEVVMPGTSIGDLREGVAAQTGLKRIPIIAPATHDTGSAVAGVPTSHTGRANWAYISSGTWSLMGVEMNAAVLTPRALELNLTNEGGVGGTYRLLKNIMGLWLVQQCRRSFEKGGAQRDYAELVRLAGEAAPLRSLVDPDDPRFLNPPDMPRAMQEQCHETDEPVPETEGQLVRCALESLALKYQLVLGWLEEATGERIEVIHVVGGGARNALLNQFTADACQRPVLAGPVEATVLGNLMVQAQARGEVSSLHQLRASLAGGSELQRFEPMAGDQWGKARQRFQRIVRSRG